MNDCSQVVGCSVNRSMQQSILFVDYSSEHWKLNFSNVSYTLRMWNRPISEQNICEIFTHWKLQISDERNQRNLCKRRDLLCHWFEGSVLSLISPMLIMIFSLSQNHCRIFCSNRQVSANINIEKKPDYSKLFWKRALLWGLIVSNLKTSYKATLIKTM